MYRATSQIMRQPSNERKDIKSKNKKLKNKHYKEYIKRLIQNNPNHIDHDKNQKEKKYQNLHHKNHRVQNQRRLKLDQLYSGRYENNPSMLINKYEQTNTVKNNNQKDEDKETFRLGIMRFTKLKLVDKDYKKFKRLFQIYNKMQKLKHQIISLNVSCLSSQTSTKIVKENSSSYNNSILLLNIQKIKEYKENLYKLEIEQEKILLSVQNQFKENFSPACKDKSIMHKENIPIAFNEIKSPSKHKNQQLVQRNFGQTASKNELSNSQGPYLDNLLKVIYQIDPTYQKIIEPSKKSNSAKNILIDDQLQFKDINIQHQFFLIYEEIRDFMTTKQKTIDQLFISLTNLNKINQKHSIKQSYAQSQGNTKTSQLIQDVGNKEIFTSQSKSKSDNNSKKQSKSFKLILLQLEQQLIGTNKLRERNTELAMKLLASTKLLNMKQQEITKLQSKQKQLQSQNDLKMREIHSLNIKINANKILMESSNNKFQEKLKLVNKINQENQDKIQKYKEQQTQFKQKQINLKEKEQILKEKESQFKTKQDQYKAHESNLNDKINEMQLKITELQEKNTQLSEKSSNKQICNRELLGYQCQIKQLTDHNDKLIQENHQLLEQFKIIKALKNLKCNQNTSKDKKQSSSMKLKTESNEYQDGYSFKLNLNNLDGPQNLSNNAINNVITSHNSQKQNNPTSLIYKEQEKKNKKLSNQNIKLKNEVDKLNSEINRLDQQNNKLNQQISKLYEERTETNQEMMLIKGSNGYLQRQNDSFKQQNERISEQIIKNNQQLAQLREKQLILTDSIQKLHEEISKKDDEIDRIKQKLQRQQEDSVNFLQIEVLIQEREQYRLSYQKLLNENMNLEEEFEYLVREKLHLEQCIKRQAQCNKKYEIKIEQLLNQNANQQEKFEQAKNNIQEMQYSLNSLKSLYRQVSLLQYHLTNYTKGSIFEIQQLLQIYRFRQPLSQQNKEALSQQQIRENQKKIEEKGINTSLIIQNNQYQYILFQDWIKQEIKGMGNQDNAINMNPSEEISQLIQFNQLLKMCEEAFTLPKGTHSIKRINKLDNSESDSFDLQIV